MERTPADQNLREALARLAAQDLDQVIDEARAEARERVRPILAEALADAMLEEARDREIARAPRDAGAPEIAEDPPEVDTEPPGLDVHSPRPPAHTARPDQATGLYVFCVVSAQATLPDDLEGLKPGTTTRLVPHNDLAALVSDVSLQEFDGEPLRENLNDIQWLERTARAHERVLETVGENNTLVPMRLCSIYRAEEGVAEMLTKEAPVLEEALQRLHDKSEWGVKVFANADPAPATASAQTANGGSGADYMRQRQTERHERQSAAQRQHDACVSIHDRLAAVAAEALTAPPQRAAATGRSEEMVLNGVYLVENEHRNEFLSLVNALQEAQEADGLELEPTGPWPAYNFVPSQAGAAA